MMSRFLISIQAASHHQHYSVVYDAVLEARGVAYDVVLEARMVRGKSRNLI